MNKGAFVKSIQQTVYIPAIEGTVEILVDPPGRQPSPVLVELSEWYAHCSSDEQRRIQDVIRLTARHAVFNILCVLDGVMTIREPDEELGVLELRYVTEFESVLLNPEEGEMLHDIFAGEVPPE